MSIATWSSAAVPRTGEPSPALLRAYRLTRYAVGAAELRIGRRAPLAARHAVLLTAWNPLSRRMPPGWNQRMQARLRAHLRRLPVLEADGRLGRWQEAHLCVLADPRPCRVMARRFRQHAIVVLARRQPARLVLLAAPVGIPARLEMAYG
jgi:hypothetical protein